MTSQSSRSIRTNRNPVTATVGDLIAAFYDEAQRVAKNPEEADRLAKASLEHCLRSSHVKAKRG